MPPAISSWMCALCEKKYGQNANTIAATAAAAESPDSRRASSHMPRSVDVNANSRAVLCAANGLRVSHQAGAATTPAPMLASE